MHQDADRSGGWRAHARAVVTMMAVGLVFLLGTPGLDYLKASAYRSNTQRREAIQELGPVGGQLAILAAEVNLHLRRPLTRKLGGIQRVFRARQSWHLYRNGPGRVRRVEVRVDGERVYLTGHATADWREAELRMRRMRPIMETTAKDPKAKNTAGMVRWIVTAAREDYPEAERVEVRAWWGRFPGKTLHLHHGWTVTAPSWEVPAAVVQKASG